MTNYRMSAGRVSKRTGFISSEKSRLRSRYSLAPIDLHRVTTIITMMMV